MEAKYGDQHAGLGTLYIFDFAYDELWTGASIPKEHWHFHARLLSRYNIVLAPGEFSDLLNCVTNGSALLIEQRSNGRSIHSYRVRSAGERIYVLVKGHHVISVWPPEKRLNALRRNLTSNGGTT